MRIASIFALGMLVMLGGCGETNPDGGRGLSTHSAKKHSLSSKDLPMRVAAASAIASDVARDQALAHVALDAAAIGQEDTVLACLDKMGSDSARSQAAAEAALKLAAIGTDRAGRGTVMAVTERISDTLQRQQTLMKIAMREY